MLAKEYSTKTSGQRAGQKMEIACFHISATFWLLKIIVFCVYVCTKHINIQLYWNSIIENTPHRTTNRYSNQIYALENCSESKRFNRNIISMMKITDKTLLVPLASLWPEHWPARCWLRRGEVGTEVVSFLQFQVSTVTTGTVRPPAAPPHQADQSHHSLTTLPTLTYLTSSTHSPPSPHSLTITISSSPHPRDDVLC